MESISISIIHERQEKSSECKFLKMLALACNWTTLTGDMEVVGHKPQFPPNAELLCVPSPE